MSFHTVCSVWTGGFFIFLKIFFDFGCTKGTSQWEQVKRLSSTRRKPFQCSLKIEYQIFKYVTCIEEPRWWVRHDLWIIRVSSKPPPQVPDCLRHGDDLYNHNDTSLWGWRSTRQRWDSYETVKLTVAWRFPIDYRVMQGASRTNTAFNQTHR